MTRHLVFSFFLGRAPRVSCLALTLGLTGLPAFAQSSSAGLGRFEISAGIIRVGQASFGGRDAEETAGTGTGRFRLFSSSTELTAVSGFGARFGVTLMRSFKITGAPSSIGMMSMLCRLTS